MTEHSDTDLNAREPEDPYYHHQKEKRDHYFHSISGRGMYCSREHKLFDPPSGMSNGDECPLCGEVVRI